MTKTSLMSPSTERLPQPIDTRSGCLAMTQLTLDVVSGNDLPVSWAEVQALYEYPSGGHRLISERADADGRARLTAPHDELPASVSVWAESEAAGTYDVESEMSLVIEV